LAHDKKKQADRVMIEKMEAVPCGAKERGMTGLGSIFASVGVTAVNSSERLCPQYLLRSDDMEYHVRPLDHKHPVLLPVGKEGEFKLSKDKLDMRIPEGDRTMRHYQVVAMKPIDHSASPVSENSRNDSQHNDLQRNDLPHKDYADKSLADKSYQDNNVKPPNPPNGGPQ
jgi:hypothetical protein